jgi:hypothetical protein
MELSKKIVNAGWPGHGMSLIGTAVTASRAVDDGNSSLQKRRATPHSSITAYTSPARVWNGCESTP